MSKKRMNKLIALLLITVMSLTLLTACGEKKPEDSTTTPAPTEAQKGNDDKDVTPEPDVTEEPEEPDPYADVDLGGMEIIIGDWWTSADEAEPQTAFEEAQRDYREMIQEKYNFTMKQVGIGGWGEHQETFIVSTMAEDPAAEIFLMGQGWLKSPMANGLFYDLETLDVFDFTEDKWQTSVVDLMTKGDSVYGMAAGHPEPKLGVFYNKRLFQEAGLDPDLPYDLQASGEWTWEKFEELLQKLTIDKTSNGVPDVYGMVSFSAELIPAALKSNGAQFVDRDENGLLYNATESAEFLEAMQWVVSLIEKGYEMPQPEDSEWDWFISAFFDGKAAMAVAEEYRIGTYKDMDDDVGFVMFPKGPRAESYHTNVSDNVAVIPASYDEETAWKIAFAYNLWTEPIPGYEDSDDWKLSYYQKYKDSRAVDETLTIMAEPGVGTPDYINLVEGIEAGDFVWNIYGLDSTPAEKVEENRGAWNSLIAEANK